MKKQALIILFIFLFISCSGQDTYNRLYRFKKNNLYGFINNNGKVIVEPQYNSTGIFSEGLCAVVKRENNESKLGYINAEGILTIPLQFQYYLYYLSDFKEGMAVVKLNNKSGYINREGKIIFQPTLYKGHPFNEGYAVIETEYGTRSVINKKGEIVFDPIETYKKQRKTTPTGRELLFLNDKISDSVITFHVSYHTNSPSTMKMGYFDMQGNMTFPFNHFIGNYHEGLTVTRNNSYSKSGYLDKKGKLVIPFGKFKNISDFKNGRAIVKDVNTKRYGIIDIKGNYIIQPEYLEISKYSYFLDIIKVVDESYKTGYISSKGVPITDFKYRYGSDFSEGLAIVYSKEKEYQFIDEKGKPAFQLKFSGYKGYLGSNFKGDLAKIVIDNKTIYINKKGEVIFKFQ